MKKKTLIILLSLIIVVLVVVAVIFKNEDKGFKVTTAEAVKRTIVETVVANGVIQPETEVIISSEVSGKILDLPFSEGAQVKQGDLLVKINPDLAQAALDRAVAALNNARASKATAEARLLQAEAQFENNQLIFERNKELLKKGAIAQSEFDNAEAAYESAEAEVMAARQNVKAADFSIESAQAGVKEASDSYDRTTIYAPMDGTISRLNVEEGEQVVGAMQMTGTEIMRVANLDVMEVLAEINESDIVRIAFGDTAIVEVDAYLDRSFKGVVTEIANSAKTDQLSTDQVTNFEVKIRILPDSYRDLISERDSLSPFRPGMNATVEIRTATRHDVLSVPIQCVTARSDTSSSEVSSVDRLIESPTQEGEPITCVFLARDGKADIQPVETGIQDDEFIEIVKGLSPDDVVISGPFDVVSQKLRHGDAIEVVSKEALYAPE